MKRGKSKWMLRALAWTLSAVLILEGAIPVLVQAQDSGTITAGDVARQAGNSAMKEKGEAAENGQSPTVTDSDTPAQTSGVTYYVDAVSGSDSGNGTSPEQAWKSINRVNQTIYKPGDRILFKAGCEWTAETVPDGSQRPETWLTPRGSGEEGNFIILSSYGEGPLPKLSGDSQVNDVLTLKDQEYWDISNLEISNTKVEFDPMNNKDSENAKHMGNFRGIHIYGQSFSENGNPGGVLDGFYLHDLYIHDVTGQVYWVSGDADRGLPGVFGKMGNDGAKRTGGILFEIWQPTTESDLTDAEKAANTKDRPITFHDIRVERNIVSDNSFGGILIKQWTGDGHGELTVGDFHVDAVPATNEDWATRGGNKAPAPYYEWAGWHPHTDVIIRDNYVSQNETLYGCNTIWVTSVKGALIENNVCSGAGTCAIELNFTDDVVIQYNEVYDTCVKAGGADSNAIDPDKQTSNALIQYNYVYNNGDGILLCGFGFGTAAVRYNIIQDSQKRFLNPHGDAGANYVYNNLFLNTKNIKNLPFVQSSGGSNYTNSKKNMHYLYNNIFYNTSSTVQTAVIAEGAGTQYGSNCYYGAAVTAPNQDETPFLTDPQFKGGAVPETLDGLMLKDTSPLLNAGQEVVLPEYFEGPYWDQYLTETEFFGNPLEKAEPDVGISEYVTSEGNGVLNGYVLDQYGDPAADALVTVTGTAMKAVCDELGFFSVCIMGLNPSPFRRNL